MPEREQTESDREEMKEEKEQRRLSTWRSPCHQSPVYETDDGAVYCQVCGKELD